MKYITSVFLASSLLASAQSAELCYDTDFADGGVSWNNNWSYENVNPGGQVGSNVWGVSPKSGLVTPSSLVWNGASAVGGTTTGFGYYSGSAPSDLGSNGTSGQISWDYGVDDLGAMAVGDETYFAILSDATVGAPELAFGTTVSAIGASDYSIDIFVRSGGTMSILDTIIMPIDVSGSGSPNYWASLGFDFAIAGGLASVTYTVDGVYDNDGTQYAANQVSNTGSTSIAVDAALLADNTNYVALGGTSQGNRQTNNTKVDNIDIKIVPEPSSLVFSMLAAFGFLFRRRR